MHLFVFGHYRNSHAGSSVKVAYNAACNYLHRRLQTNEDFLLFRVRLNEIYSPLLLMGSDIPLHSSQHGMARD